MAYDRFSYHDRAGGYYDESQSYREVPNETHGSFSSPYHRVSGSHTRPKLSSRRQYRSEYIVRSDPSQVDYIAPDSRSHRRSRRDREHNSRSYAADYIAHPSQFEEDHISPRQHSSTAASTNTYIDPMDTIYPLDEGTYQGSGFCQPYSTKPPSHQRHASMPTFNTSYEEGYSFSRPPNPPFDPQNDSITSNPTRPHRQDKYKSSHKHSDRRTKRSKHRSPRLHRDKDPDAYGSDFQDESEIPVKPTKSQDDYYASDYEPLFSKPRDSSRIGRNAYPSDDEIKSRSSSCTFDTNEIETGFSRPRPSKMTPSPRRRKNYVSDDSSISVSDGESSGSEEFGSDVEFDEISPRRRRWDNASIHDRSDYVADSVSSGVSDDSDVSEEDLESEEELSTGRIRTGRWR